MAGFIKLVVLLAIFVIVHTPSSASARPGGCDAPASPSSTQDDDEPFVDVSAYPVKWSGKSAARNVPTPSSAPPTDQQDGDDPFVDASTYPVKWSAKSAARNVPTPSSAPPPDQQGHSVMHVQRGMLFAMKSLIPGALLAEGTKLQAHGGVAAQPPTRLATRADADAVPFDYSELDAILDRFGIHPGSKKAAQVSETLLTCAEMTAASTASEDEPRICATSHEAVVEFAAFALGAGATPRAVTTVVHGRGDEPRRYMVAPNGVARIGGDATVPCHPMPYPYEVFYCHRPKDAVALSVELAGVGGDDDGDAPLGATAIAMCHMNTTMWDGRYFDLLGARRGDAICHYMPQSYVLWVARLHIWTGLYGNANI
uniref:BURP domain-containing protein n=1 Tax=Leersia perrieri TaxID=77586 RepID=A0A0D9VEY9_9ORYZ